MKPVLKFFSCLLSLILSIALFAIITACVMLFSIKHSFSESGIKRAVSQIDFSSLIELRGDTKSGITDGDRPNGAYTVRPMSLKSAASGDDSGFKISGSIQDRLEQFGIDGDKLESYLSSELLNSLASELFARYSAGFTEYMLSGKTDTVADADFLGGLFEKNMDDFLEYFSLSLSRTEKDELLGVFNDLAGDIVNELPGYDELEDTLFKDSDIDFNAIRDSYLKPVFSKTSTIAAVAAIIGALALLMLLRMSWFRWMIWAGVPMLLSGLFVLGGSLIIRGVLNTVLSEESLNKTGILEIFNQINSSFVLFGVITVILAVILIVMYSVFSAGARRAQAQRRMQTAPFWQGAPQQYPMTPEPYGGMPQQYYSAPTAPYVTPQQYAAPLANRPEWQPQQDAPQQETSESGQAAGSADGEDTQSKQDTNG